MTGSEERRRGENLAPGMVTEFDGTGAREEQTLLMNVVDDDNSGKNTKT